VSQITRSRFGSGIRGKTSPEGREDSMMKCTANRKRHRPEEVVAKLRQAGWRGTGDKEWPSPRWRVPSA
jgi:hypothetical protein